MKAVVRPNKGGRSASGRRTVLEARRVSKIYRMGEVDVVALRDVDFALRESEFHVLLGASGSGKSTLMSILGGLDRPTSGQVFFRDRDLSGANDRVLKEFHPDHVGFVLQFYTLMPNLTARENVALATEISRDPLQPDEALELMGMGDRMNRFPSQLSGGEQQRVAIARAIAKRPEVLLCDEPTGALDYRSGILVLNAIERAGLALGTTTVVITHNAPVSEMADRIVTLVDGPIAQDQINETRRPGVEPADA